MKKEFMLNKIKRFGVGFLTAAMLFTGFQAVSASDNGDGASNTDDKVSVERTKFSASMNGFTSNDTAYLQTQKVPAAATVTEDGTIEITDENVNSIALGIATAKAREEIPTLYKYSVSFDIKTSSTGANGEIYIFDDDTAGKNRRVGRMQFSSSTITLFNNGNDSTKTVVNITPDEWVSLKYVVYPKTSTSDINRLEWYIDDELVSVGESNSTTSMFPENRNFNKICAFNGKGTQYKNFKLEGIEKADIDKSQATEALSKLGGWKAPDSAATGIVEKAAATVAESGADGIKMLKAGNVIKVKEDTLEFYDKYSVSFDVKTVSQGADDSTLLSRVYLYDKNSNVNPDKETQKTGARALGFFELYDNKLVLSTNGGYMTNGTQVPITAGEWVNIEYVITPGESGGNKFMWYINGELKSQGEIAKTWEKSETGILRQIQPTEVVADSIYFNNFNVSKVNTFEKNDANKFAASASITGLKQIELSFNKTFLPNLPIMNNIKVKDAGGNAVNIQNISLSADNSKVTLALANELTSEYYSVYLPERLLSNDGQVLSVTVSATPHFEITQTGFDENSESSTISFKTAYKNTKDQPENIIAVIVAYDKTTGVLKAVDTKQYTVEANAEFEPSEYPTINKDSNTEIKGFIWSASTYAPRYIVTPAQ